MVVRAPVHETPCPHPCHFRKDKQSNEMPFRYTAGIRKKLSVVRKSYPISRIETYQVEREVAQQPSNLERRAATVRFTGFAVSSPA